MKPKKQLTLAALVALALVAVTIGMAAAQETPPQPIEGVDAPGANVGNYIPVQGRLTDASGNPLDGSFSITFRLYDVLSGGTALCQDTNTVTVEDGLFNSEIWGNCGTEEINGQQLYLGIEVGSDGEMTPRQPIYAAPYAWSLKPGAVISSSFSGDAVLHIENSGASGRGLRSYAMAESGTNYGVVGASRSVDGYGGYFYNSGGGVGLFGSTDDALGFGVVGLQPDYSTADLSDQWESGGFFGGTNGVVGISHETVRVGAGVFGWAQAATATSYGVRGQADSTSGRGVYGRATAATGTTYGVYGASDSTSGRGVYGLGDASTGTNYGVYGETDSDSGRGVYGYASNAAGGVGVEGSSTVGTGVYGHSSSGYGVYGLSASSRALYGDTQAADHNYGVYTPDNLYSLNYHTRGAILQIVQNGGGEPLEAGDVVVFAGIGGLDAESGLPIILVAKAGEANTTAVAGVVYSACAADGTTVDGPAASGDALLLVIEGLARVKVNADGGAIQAGDLLSASAQAGFAAKSPQTLVEGVWTSLPGSVFGKALEAWESGAGYVYVFVTLQ